MQTRCYVFAIMNSPSCHPNPREHKYSRLNWVVLCAGLLMILSGLVFIRSDFTVSATGVVERSVQVSVYAPRTGTLASIFVEEGQRIKKGDPILQLDDRALAMRTLSMKREIAAVQAGLDNAKLALEMDAIKPGSLELMTAGERLELLGEISSIQQEIVDQYEKLEGQRAVKGVDLQRQRIEQARSRMQELEAQMLNQWKEGGILAAERKQLEMSVKHHEQTLGLLQKELNLMEKELERSTVRSPMDGLIVNLAFEHVGMKVEEGQFLFETTDPESSFEVLALVGERNVDLIHKGIPVRMESRVFQSTLEGYILGTVMEVSPVAENDRVLPSEAPLYEVRIAVEETPYDLVLGSTLTTEFILGERNLWEVILSSMSGSAERPRERQSEE